MKMFVDFFFRTNRRTPLLEFQRHESLRLILVVKSFEIKYLKFFQHRMYSLILLCEKEKKKRPIRFYLFSATKICMKLLIKYFHQRIVGQLAIRFHHLHFGIKCQK